MSDSRPGAHAELVYRATTTATPLPDATRHPVAAPPAATVDISWRRCVNDFKLDPVREYEPRVLDHSQVKELQCELDELVHIARAEMDSLYEQIAGSGYALLLADTQGIILCEKMDPTLKQMFGRAGLIVGAEWSERCEGTNGIGTCATEARPVTIHQADHFRSRHAGLSCSAAPIHDPHGRVIAVLDASCVKAEGPRETQLHTIALVNSSARLIEKCLFLRCFSADAMLRFHHRPEFVDLLHDGAIAIGADGRIVASDATGLRLLGAHDRTELIGRSIAEVFAVEFETMCAAARNGHRTIWQVRDNRFGRRYFATVSQSSAPVPKFAPPPAAGQVVLRLKAEPNTSVRTLTDLAGDDPRMISNVRSARRIANSTVRVLIYGPTGSGKEAFARALHMASARARQPFVPVNCAAIPEALIESELFGYANGAFTGARREGMRGRIVLSSGGTLFLDEIGDMPLLMQTRLLRVLEEQEVTPLGSETAIKVDLRVICATHRDLREMIARGQFREDLYYRLNGLTLELPSLTARRDKESLIRKSIASEWSDGPVACVEASALECLCDYEWPGNIRELRNTVRAVLAICEDGVIRRCDLAPQIRRAIDRSKQVDPPPALISEPADNPAQPLAAAERAALQRVILAHHGHMTQVARHLGISRNTLYRKIKRLRIKIARCPANG